MKPTLPETLAPFVAHGCEFTRQVGKEWVGTAPFSEKPGHLYVNGETGQWSEKQTGDSGNVHTFLEKLSEEHRAAFTPEREKALAARFRLPPAAVTVPGVGYDERRRVYTFTIRNAKGTVVDIRSRGLEPKSKTLSTRGCKTGMWGHDDFAAAKPGEPVYVVEGESDRLAGVWLLRALKKPGVVVAVPGAGTFKDEWAGSFKGRKVRILFDNDDAGRAGAAKAARVLRSGDVQDVLVWKHDEDWDAGLDLRDFITNAIKQRIPLATCLAAIEKRYEAPEQDADEAPSRERFVFTPAADLMNASPLGYIVEKFIPERGLCALIGQPGCGKSVLAHALAVAIAAGVPAFGRDVQSGLVLLIAAEGVGGLPARLRAATARLEAKQRQHALSRLLVLPEAPRMQDSLDVSALIAAAERLDERPRLVVLDTLARCLPGGDENSAQDVGLLVQGCDRLRDALGCATLVLHHTTKDGSTERGSSALRGAADVLSFVKMKEGIVTVEVDKARDFEPPKPMTLRLVPEGDSVRLEHIDREGFVAQVRGMAVLGVLRRTGGWVPLQRIKEACKDKGERSIERHLSDLVTAGAVLRRKVGTVAEYRVAAKAGGAK
ncbi:MAG: helicase RepA family protein [Phycisphaerales bacterium]|nr:helicase RepA family protein [Phycisphaerales bacterium]